MPHYFVSRTFIKVLFKASRFQTLICALTVSPLQNCPIDSSDELLSGSHDVMFSNIIMNTFLMTFCLLLERVSPFLSTSVFDDTFAKILLLTSKGA